jgi:NodT family efflux transporter outer membrane factor (OMF) lipoprotein
MRHPHSRLRFELAHAGTPTVAALAALLGVGGCMVGPDYETPEAEVNSAWLEPAENLEGPRLEIDREIEWWRSFNDPTMTALIEKAVSQNLTLRTAGLRVLEARARRGLAVGEFFPQMQELFGSISQRQLSENEIAGMGDQSYAEAAFGLEAAWELDFWGKFRRGIEASDAELLADVANYDAALVSLIADVATNYIVARSLQERIKIAAQNVELQRETLDLTRTRFELGAVSELDVATAKSTLNTTQATIPVLQDDLRQAKLALGVLLGQPPSELEAELGSPDDTPTGVPIAPPSIAAGVPADLLRRRPDIRAAERFAAAQSARIGIATADLYPSISIAGSTGFIAADFDTSPGPELSDLFNSSSFAGFLGLRLNWPVLNYGRIENTIRAQDARFEQAVAAYQESVLRAAADVEAGLSIFLRAQERSGYLAMSVEAAQRSVELSLIQYRAGAADFIRVNDAQTVLAQQQDQLVVSHASVAIGAVTAYRALGGGWEIRENTEFVDAATAARMRERTDWGDILDPDWSERGGGLFRRPQEVPPAEGAGR